MLSALHYTHFCLLLIFKCSVERLEVIRKWVGYYGKMPVPSFHCCLGACYTQALPRIFTMFWIPKKSVIKSSHPKKFQYLKFQTPKNPLIIPVNWNQESKSEKKQDGNQQQATEYLPKCKRHTGKFVTHITKENCNKKVLFKNSSK